MLKYACHESYSIKNNFSCRISEAIQWAFAVFTATLIGSTSWQQAGQYPIEFLHDVSSALTLCQQSAAACGYTLATTNTEHRAASVLSRSAAMKVTHPLLLLSNVA